MASFVLAYHFQHDNGQDSVHGEKTGHHHHNHGHSQVRANHADCCDPSTVNKRDTRHRHLSFHISLLQPLRSTVHISIQSSYNISLASRSIKKGLSQDPNLPQWPKEKKDTWKGERWEAKKWYEIEKKSKEKRTTHLQSTTPDRLGQQESVKETQERRYRPEYTQTHSWHVLH